jgi:Ca-activated chloride channel family protein
MFFQHPSFLHLLWSLPALLFLWAGYRRWRRRAIRRLGDPDLVERLLPPQSAAAFWTRQILFLLSLTLFILAAANPQRGVKVRQVRQESADVILAFDISQSMYCADMAPSRLERARIFALKLMKALEGERIGLIFFAGNAYLQMPLSSDYEAAAMFLQAAAPDMASEQGTSLARALETARGAFDPESKAGRVLVLITDGEDHEAGALKQAAAAYEDGIVVYTVGVGTEAGGPIPLGGLQYKRDASDRLVHSSLNEPLLRAIAEAGQGESCHIRQGASAIQTIKEGVDRLEKRAVERRSYSDFESYFQWLLAPAILLFLLSQLPYKTSTWST